MALDDLKRDCKDSKLLQMAELISRKLERGDQEKTEDGPVTELGSDV